MCLTHNFKCKWPVERIKKVPSMTSNFLLGMNSTSRFVITTTIDAKSLKIVNKLFVSSLVFKGEISPT